jgi:hypothetical protein
MMFQGSGSAQVQPLSRVWLSSISVCIYRKYYPLQFATSARRCASSMLAAVVVGCGCALQKQFRFFLAQSLTPSNGSTLFSEKP